MLTVSSTPWERFRALGKENSITEDLMNFYSRNAKEMYTKDMPISECLNVNDLQKVTETSNE